MSGALTDICQRSLRKCRPPGCGSEPGGLFQEAGEEMYGENDYNA